MRYVPPLDWQQCTLGDLLQGTRRLVPVAGKAEVGGRTRTYVAGDVRLLKEPAVSIIGSRKISETGADQARTLAAGLAAAKIVVMSGLAQGVDTEAMTAAIEAGGRTIGVIGTPLDKAYPAANARLQETVYRDHLLVSPFANGAVVRSGNFPRRNKLMSALSDATVVIEASDKSGTLHQARECVRLGRWLFIARRLVADSALTWPSMFAGYDRCVAFDDATEVITRVRIP